MTKDERDLLIENAQCLSTLIKLMASNKAKWPVPEFADLYKKIDEELLILISDVTAGPREMRLLIADAAATPVTVPSIPTGVTLEETEPRARELLSRVNLRYGGPLESQAKGISLTCVNSHCLNISLLDEKGEPLHTWPMVTVKVGRTVLIAPLSVDATLNLSRV